VTHDLGLELETPCEERGQTPIPPAVTQSGHRGSGDLAIY